MLGDAVPGDINCLRLCRIDWASCGGRFFWYLIAEYCPYSTLGRFQSRGIGHVHGNGGRFVTGGKSMDRLGGNGMAFCMQHIGPFELVVKCRGTTRAHMQ